MSKRAKFLLMLAAFFCLPLVNVGLWKFALIASFAIGLIGLLRYFSVGRVDPAIAFGCGIAAVGVFYFFTTSTSAANPSLLNTYPRGFYNLLVDGFTHGQLSLLEGEPGHGPDWWALRGVEVNIVDASTYNGKHYIYWGVAPVVTLMLPVHLLTGEYVSIWFACFVFGFLAFVASALFIRRFLQREFAVELDSVDSFLLLLATGFCSTLPIIMRRPADYEIAILAGAGFYMLSLYLMELARDSKWWLLLSGLAFALAVGSRPTFIIGFIPLAFLFLRSHWRKALWFLTPIVLVGIALGVYNYLRFDSFFEFGFNHQGMYYQHATGWPLIRAALAYFYNWPNAQTTFPFFFLAGMHFPIHLDGFTSDTFLGLVFAAPFVLLSVFVWRCPRWFLFWSLSIFATVIALMLINGYAGLNARYAGDFFPLALVVPLIVVFTRARRFTYGLFIVSTVVGFTVCFFLSFTGVDNLMARNRPFGLAAIAAVLGP